MLINSIRWFAPFQIGYAAEVLQYWDKQLIQASRKTAGLSKTDVAHYLFLPGYLFGLGSKTFTEADVKATVRELEIILMAAELNQKYDKQHGTLQIVKHQKDYILEMQR